MEVGGEARSPVDILQGQESVAKTAMAAAWARVSVKVK